MRHRNYLAVASAFALALGAAACGDDDSDSSAGTTGSGSSSSGELSGSIAIDGSSTVYPFAQAAAEMFQTENPNVQITVGQSGTGGGFEKFCAGETDISDASRPIEPEEEKLCADGGVDYSQLQVANDGIAVVSNRELPIDCLTVDQLNQLWADDKVSNYAQIDPAFPDVEVSLFGPGTDSGTFDYFTDAINGEEGLSRKDYQPSEDDNVLVQGVEGDVGGLGYFGFSYYEQNADKLNLIGVDAGDGCVKPEMANIQDASYQPLSRPIFMYPSTKALETPAVKAFMDFAIANQETIAENAAMVPMTPEQASKAEAAVQ